MMSRRLPSILPNRTEQLRPQVTPQNTERARRESWQQRQKEHYSRSTKPLSPLHAGTPIRFQQGDGTWKPATVLQPAEIPSCYHIRAGNGQTFRCNRHHLVSNHTPVIQQPEISEDDTGRDTENDQQQPVSVSEPDHSGPYRARCGCVINQGKPLTEKNK